MRVRRCSRNPAPRVGALLGPLLILALLLLPGPGASATSPRTSGTVAPAQSKAMAAFDSHIQHIVIVVMENHAYDNLFGVYCLHTGTYCSSTSIGLSPSLCVPLYPNNASAGCVTPYNHTSLDHVYGAMYHTARSSQQAWNHGAMDGFYTAENSHLLPFGHYTANTTATLWDMAEEYGLGDNFFSATLSYSLPNHWHLVSATAPSAIQSGGIEAGQGPVANRTAYLNEANQTPTIDDLLVNSTASWAWYEWPIGSNYSASIGSTKPGAPAGRAFGLWNPQAAKAQSYTSTFSSHFVANTQFYADAAAGQLPNVSWVIPLANESDHPSYSHDEAEDWLASVVDALEASPDWNTSAIFVTYDEYGGFYDQVAPPIVDGAPLGFRVPLLVIGPYVRENYIGRGLGYFDSLLRLVELRYHLGCFGALDCNAPLPLGFFNFSMPPRPPILFGTDTSQVHYPMPLQNASAASPSPGALQFTIPYVFLHPPLNAYGQPNLGLD